MSEKNVQAERPKARTLKLAEFKLLQADRGLDLRGNENLEAEYLKGITGVWEILRRELAHERII